MSALLSSALPSGPMVNVGSGPASPAGWINIDGSAQAWFAAHPALSRLATRLTGRQVGHWPSGVVYRDVRRGLGFPQASVAAVFSSHFVEHLYRDEALCFLRDAYRALAPGGACRIVVPDVAAIVDWYLERRTQPPARQPPAEQPEASSDVLMGLLGVHSQRRAPGKGLLALYRRRTDFDAHKWMYDADGLVALFREAGFEDPAPRKHLDSSIPRDALAAVERADRIDNGAGICVEARR
jgi:SAM-dependent methyltransferase